MIMLGLGLYWKYYDGSTWSTETAVSGHSWTYALSFVYNDLFLVSNSGSHIYYRQYDAYPSAPQNLALSDNGGHPRLTWPQNIDADVNQYKIYRNVGHGGWASIGTTNNVYYDDLTISICTLGTCGSLQYQISAIDLGGLESQSYSNIVLSQAPGGEYKTKGQNPSEVITDYKLGQNYPNPFNPSTNISYQLPQAGLVQLKVYNLLGKEVAVIVNEFKPGGKYSTNFDAVGLPSGVYIYSLRVNGFIQNQKMTLMK